MPIPRHIAVIDIGKTNAKVALVDLATRAELSVDTCPNRVLPGPPWPHFDTETLWSFITAALARLQATHGIDAISVTTHGASAALLAADGSLAAPVLDYEHGGPDDLRARYEALRPAFSETGSPPLPAGLNLGAQIHWQLHTDPSLSDRLHRVVTWPQYWGYRLTGALACDVTSLGCHTDLWNPHLGQFSGLVDRLGLTGRFAPPQRPGNRLGLLHPEIASATGLRRDTPVACGIHDSNASLLPHLLGRRGAFSVVSTGTWVVAMTMGGRTVTLDPARDTLINVNAFGNPVASARFMGGREHDIIAGTASVTPTQADVTGVLDQGLLLLPSVQPGSGPFPASALRWVGGEPAIGDGPREVALGYYLALMTAECLAMTGADGPAIIEGPFARNAHFLAMLAAGTGRPVEASASRTGTAVGAALLFADDPAPDQQGGTGSAPVTPPDARLVGYAARWRQANAARHGQA